MVCNALDAIKRFCLIALVFNEIITRILHNYQRKYENSYVQKKKMLNFHCYKHILKRYYSRHCQILLYFDNCQRKCSAYPIKGCSNEMMNIYGEFSRLSAGHMELVKAPRMQYGLKSQLLHC